jgi:hypothetical protein
MTCPLCTKPATADNGTIACQSSHCGYRYSASTEVVL